MKKTTISTMILGTIVSFGFVSFSGADPARSESMSGLEGRIFAVDAEVVMSLDPEIPAGATFNNCYIFEEGGVWIDPLFPDPANGIVIPGTWLQHSELPEISYTAVIDLDPVDPDPGLLLVQNGTVNHARGNGNQGLTAYTTVFFGGIPIIEVLSKGRAVDSCPFFEVP